MDVKLKGKTVAVAVIALVLMAIASLNAISHATAQTSPDASTITPVVSGISWPPPAVYVPSTLKGYQP